MTDGSQPNVSSESEEDQVSRLKFLQSSLFGAAFAGTSALPALGALQAAQYGGSAYARGYGTVSKAVARYQYHPNVGQDCAICAHFRPPGSCEIVAGRIVPNGWCRYFAGRGGYRAGGGYRGGAPSRGY